MTIKNATAYENGKQANIRQNARTTRNRKWFAAHDDAQRLHDFLTQSGEFSETWRTENPSDQEEYDGEIDRAYNKYRNDYGEYLDARNRLDEKYHAYAVPHPVTCGMYSGEFGAFLLSLSESYFKWGSLSPKQTNVVRNALARREGWVIVETYA